MTRHFQYLLYIIFAFCSMAINLTVQFLAETLLLKMNIDFLLRIVYKPFTVTDCLKLALATVIAFIFKFFVDKLVVFKDESDKLKDNIRQVLIYGSFAVFTTLIFWGTTYLFKLFFTFPYAGYLGSFTGLCIGFTIKFILDSKFVFVNTNSMQEA